MLQKFGWIALLIFANPTFAQHYPDKPATHGMLLIGSETIYASHLPMFHSPHDYQIILALKFDTEKNQKYIEDRKTHPDEFVYTIKPEAFVLPEMVNRTKKFKGNIYRGHFERGGVVIAKDVDVSIRRVVYFNQFKSGTRKPGYLRYILFGNSKEQFLAHQITARPDFDEVVSVKLKNETPGLLQSAAYKIIEFDEKDNRNGFSWKTNSAKLDVRSSIYFTSHHQLYFELGDLE
jgi:hypothetical protein